MGVLLIWIALGAVAGYVAAHRRSFSPITGVVAGLVLGPLAVVLFYIPRGVTGSERQQKCPYCAGRLASGARVCVHCGAILQDGSG
jgi:hypothetical protein